MKICMDLSLCIIALFTVMTHNHHKCSKFLPSVGILVSYRATARNKATVSILYGPVISDTPSPRLCVRKNDESIIIGILLMAATISGFFHLINKGF